MTGDLRLRGGEGKRSLNDRLKVTKVVKVAKVVETTTKQGAKRGAINFTVNFGRRASANVHACSR